MPSDPRVQQVPDMRRDMRLEFKLRREADKQAHVAVEGLLQRQNDVNLRVCGGAGRAVERLD